MTKQITTPETSEIVRIPKGLASEIDSGLREAEDTGCADDGDLKIRAILANPVKRDHYTVSRVFAGEFALKVETALGDLEAQMDGGDPTSAASLRSKYKAGERLIHTLAALAS